MIIFGTRGVTYNAGEGRFHCPQCGKRTYSQKRVRRFFTLYFIPLIPLDMLGEYIECHACRGTYRTEVLGFDPAVADRRFEAEFQIAARRTMVLMCLADGVIDDQEVTMIRETYGKLADAEITEADVRQEIDVATKDGRSVEDYLGGIVGTLNDSAKEAIVRAAFMVAAADGQFDEKEKQLLGEIGGALQMSPAHLRGVLSTMLQEDTASLPREGRG
jgi:uncharacterized tellurite resistance protein B-like protein